MPTLEYNFNDDQLNVIQTSDVPHNFDENFGDYIKVTVFDTNDNFIGEYTSKRDNLVIYRDGLDDIYIKPNEVLKDAGIPQGNYKLQIDFLQNYFTPNFSAAEHNLLPSSAQEGWLWSWGENNSSSGTCVTDAGGPPTIEHSNDGEN